MVVENLVFIVNKKAGNKTCFEKWERFVASLQKEKKKKVKVFFPKEKSEIVKIIKEERPKIVISVGGDGSANAVITAIQESEIKNRPIFGIFPFGFGNALANNLGIYTLEDGISAVEKEKVTQIDLMKSNIREFPFGAFNIGAGFDAKIVSQAAQNQHIGFHTYLFSALLSLVTHKDTQLKIVIDETIFLEGKVAGIMIANAPYAGKGMLIAPEAKLCDGILDCTVFPSKYSYMRNIRFKGFKNPLYFDGGKMHFKAKKVKIEGETFAHVDGDPVKINTPLRVEILPKAQKVFSLSE